jgi:hypothetical protein
MESLSNAVAGKTAKKDCELASRTQLFNQHVERLQLVTGRLYGQVNRLCNVSEREPVPKGDDSPVCETHLQRYSEALNKQNSLIADLEHLSDMLEEVI